MEIMPKYQYLTMLLGIDFGTKNIGLAISDDTQKIALALPSIDYKNRSIKLERLIEKYNVDICIVGYPEKTGNNAGRVTLLVDKFLEEIKAQFPNLNTTKIDESLSTAMAKSSLREQGYSSKSIEKLKDSEAARIILQSYLDIMYKDHNF